MRILTIVLALSFLSAQARLGETREQLAARFGKATSTDLDSALFEKNGVKIMASFHQGNCYSLVYRADQAFLPEQVVQLLKGNQLAGQTWVDQLQGLRREKDEWNFTTNDNTRTCMGQKNVLFFTVTKVMAAKEAEKKARQVQQTSGF